MLYIKIDDNSYLNNNNLKKVLEISGEILEGENCFELNTQMIEDVYPVSSKNDILWNTDTQKLQYKTAEQKQQEIIEKQSAELLNNLLPLMTAMNIQENGKIKGADPIKAMFTDTEIKEWSEYIADIASGNISAEMPELNNIAKKIFKL